jgi:hypothetical protein
VIGDSESDSLWVTLCDSSSLESDPK